MVDASDWFVVAAVICHDVNVDVMVFVIVLFNFFKCFR